MEIHIIRHIEPAIKKGICYGQTDVLLHDGYEKTHKQIAKNIDTDFSQIYSSPLLRCKLLAQEISKDIIYDVRLMEVNFGDWEMKKWDEINKQEIDIWMENYIEKAPPNGESLNDLIYRFKNFVTEKKQDKKILIVAHAGIIRCAFYLFNKIAIDKIMMIKIEHGIIYKFNCEIK